MAFLEGCERLFTQDDIDAVDTSSMTDTYIGLLEASHQCDLLYIHGCNLDNCIHNTFVYSKEDNSGNIFSRIWQGIQKFIKYVISKITELYEWFMKLIMNFEKEITTLQNKISEVPPNTSIPGEDMRKLDSVSRPSLTDLKKVKDITTDILSKDITNIIRIKLVDGNKIPEIRDTGDPIVSDIEKNIEELSKVLSSSGDVYTDEYSRSTISDLLKDSVHVLETSNVFKRSYNQTMDNLRKVEALAKKNDESLPADELKQKISGINKIINTLVKAFSVYTKATSKYMFSVIMITRTFIKATSQDARSRSNNSDLGGYRSIEDKEAGISEAFYKAIEEHDLLSLRIMIKDSLLVDPSYRQVNRMLELVKDVPEMYEEHDGREVSYDKSKWNTDYMNTKMVQIVDNFSKERLEHLKQVVHFIFAEFKKAYPNLNPRTQRNLNDAMRKNDPILVRSIIVTAGDIDLSNARDAFKYACADGDPVGVIEEHNPKMFNIKPKEQWDKAYFIRHTQTMMRCFSKEAFKHYLEVGAYLFPERVK